MKSCKGPQIDDIRHVVEVVDGEVGVAVRREGEPVAPASPSDLHTRSGVEEEVNVKVTATEHSRSAIKFGIYDVHNRTVGHVPSQSAAWSVARQHAWQERRSAEGGPESGLHGRQSGGHLSWCH